MMQCIDPVVGKILAGWRYDISGITPEMRVDYEAHFAACEFCRSRQRLHRTIDVALIVLASVSAMVFLLAYGVIRYFGPRNAFLLELAAGGGIPALHTDLAHRSRFNAGPAGGGGRRPNRSAPRPRQIARTRTRTHSGRAAAAPRRTVIVVLSDQLNLRGLAGGPLNALFVEWGS